MLGDHCVGQGSSGKSMYKRPIKFNTVDKHMFLDKLSQCEMPEDYQDHESATPGSFVQMPVRQPLLLLNSLGTPCYPDGKT